MRQSKELVLKDEPIRQHPGLQPPTTIQSALTLGHQQHQQQMQMPSTISFNHIQMPSSLSSLQGYKPHHAMNPIQMVTTMSSMQMVSNPPRTCYVSAVR